MPQDDRTRREREQQRDANRDPISGAPGSHPVGTGVGALAGGAAGAGGAAAAGAATGAALGPAGVVGGAAVGAVVGGLAGHGIAEKVNPTEEDAYWREHHRTEPYYNASYNYDDYQGAYRTGYEGWSKWGTQGRRYEEIEPDLRREYETRHPRARLSWEHARHATRAAWQRLDRNLDRYIGYDVVDQNRNSIGTLECLWADTSGEPAFIGVKTGWLFGKTHVVPASKVDISERHRHLRLPYSEDKVKDAPAYDADAEMTFEKEQEVYRYYGISSMETGRTAETRPGQHREYTATTGTTGVTREHEERSIPLREEQVVVGKREVEAGGVRLRKIIRTETVNQPVELKREEIVIERVPSSGRADATAEFNQEDIYIPLRREVPVVEKTAHVREEVRARKTSTTDRQQVSETIRKEDVEVEQTGEANRMDPNREQNVETPRMRQERTRSQRQTQK